jgi:ribosomal protein S14
MAKKRAKMHIKTKREKAKWSEKQSKPSKIWCENPEKGRPRGVGARELGLARV